MTPGLCGEKVHSSCACTPKHLLVNIPPRVGHPMAKLALFIIEPCLEGFRPSHGQPSPKEPRKTQLRAYLQALDA